MQIYSQICSLVSKKKIFEELIPTIIEKQLHAQEGLI